MIDGYFAFLSGWIALVLLWMGAFPSLPGKLGVRRKTIVAFLVICWAGAMVEVPATSRLSFNLGGFLLPVAAAAILWAREKEKNRLYLFAAGILLGSSAYLIHRLLIADPVFMVIEEVYFLALLCILFSLITVHRVAHHIVVITFGLIAEQLLFSSYVSDKLPEIVLGDGFYRNVWWLSLILAFIIQEGLNYFRNWSLFRRSRVKNENSQ